MSSVNLAAVEKAISDAGSGIPAAYGPLVELVRALARQVDEAGAEGPSARLAAAYLSALKDFGKVAAAVHAAAAAEKPLDALEEFRREHFHAIPSRAGKVAS